MSGEEIRVNPGSRLNGWHGCTSVLCTVSLQQYHTHAEGVALGHRCRKSQSNPIYQLWLLKGRADAALDFYFTDLTPGFMGRVQAHIAGHHLNTYLSCRKRPWRQAVLSTVQSLVLASASHWQPDCHKDSSPLNFILLWMGWGAFFAGDTHGSAQHHTSR